MDPLGSTTATPESAIEPADTAGLQESAQGLADQLDGQAPAAPAAEPPTPAAAPPPARVGLGEHYRKFGQHQTGARERYRQDRVRAGELRRIEQEYDARIERQNASLKQALDALQARGAIAPEEKIPDPLDPGFAQWLDARLKNQDGVKEALKPVLDAIQKQEERFSALEQERAQEEQFRQAETGMKQQYLGWEKDYARESPELAEGVRDRYLFGLDRFSAALQATGQEPEEARRIGMMILHAVANGEAAVGGNGVAAIDAFLYNLTQGFWDAIREDLAADGIQIPAFEDGGAAAAPGGNGHQPAAPQTEIQRLAAVQQRAAPASNAAPRVANRTGGATSELVLLWNGGVRDHRQLQAAALKDAGGNMMRAQEALGQLIDSGF